jgi:PAS domain S-box-containing protein
MYYADAKGQIAFWNNGAERIFGFSEAGALERSLDIIIPKNLGSVNGTTTWRRRAQDRAVTVPATFLQCWRSARMGRASRSGSRIFRSAMRQVG